MIPIYVTRSAGVKEEEVVHAIKALEEIKEHTGLDMELLPLLVRGSAKKFDEDEKKFFDAEKKFVDAEALADVLDSKFHLRVHLTNKKITGKGVENVWGHSRGNTMICSVKAIRNAMGSKNVADIHEAIEYVVQHEFGEAVMGKHCKNPCVMAKGHTDEEKKSAIKNKPPGIFCPACRKKIQAANKEHMR
ncbi:MAG: hypothetical protein KAW41_06580 [Candidatus Diapherotrites archaeon]|nr:hypothetical protein [Candidatus Diapherotrites archaeon]